MESTVLGGRILLSGTEDLEDVPAEYAKLPFYTLEEVEALVGATPADLRAVHAAKVALDGTIVARPPAAGPRRPQAASCEECGAILRGGPCGFCGRAA